MQLLLDTHVLLWWATADRRLSRTARELVSDTEHRVFISAATFWEISIKKMLGRIDIDLLELRKSIADDGFDELPVTITHTLALSALPVHHRDPFDRLLIAQAMAERCSLVTGDKAIHGYSDLRGLELIGT